MVTLKQALKLWIPVSKSAWSWILFLTFGALILEEATFRAAQLPPGAREPSTVLTAVVVFLMLFWVIVGNLLLAMVSAREVWVISKRQPLPSVLELTSKYWKPLTLESIRALGWTIVKALMFVIPGLIAFIQYLFVPYIVLLDERYHRGEMDALERSKTLAKNQTWFLFFVNSFFLLIVLLLQTVAQGLKWSLWQAPLASTLTQIAIQLISLLASIWMFCIYMSRCERIDSPEGHLN